MNPYVSFVLLWTSIVSDLFLWILIFSYTLPLSYEPLCSSLFFYESSCPPCPFMNPIVLHCTTINFYDLQCSPMFYESPYSPLFPYEPLMLFFVLKWNTIFSSVFLWVPMFSSYESLCSPLVSYESLFSPLFSWVPISSYKPVCSLLFSHESLCSPLMNLYVPLTSPMNLHVL